MRLAGPRQALESLDAVVLELTRQPQVDMLKGHCPWPALQIPGTWVDSVLWAACWKER